jgi:hypothetical protein
MRSRIGALTIAASLLHASSAGLAQTAVQTPAQTTAAAKVSQDFRAVENDNSKPPASPTSLAGEADTLYELAAELKVQVDRTNKNILSMTVVRKAQAIEQLAHQMKQQAKK